MLKPDGEANTLKDLKQTNKEPPSCPTCSWLLDHFTAPLYGETTGKTLLCLPFLASLS